MTYKRERLFDQINNQKQQNNNSIKMKIYAAALLALGTAALSLSQDTAIAGENADGHPVDAEGNRVLPHEAPDCGEPPSEAEATAAFASPEAFAAVVDAANAEGVADGTITEHEAFNALYCLATWGAIEEDEAWEAFDGFQETYGAGGSVSVEDAAADIAAALAEEE